jgi:hypothetical protein
MPTTTHRPHDPSDILCPPPPPPPPPAAGRQSGATTPSTDVPGGLLRLLASDSAERARTHGVSAAVRDLFRTETFLRAFRRHLLLTPPDARGDSYGVGLIIIELMIVRESRHSFRRPLLD